VRSDRTSAITSGPPAKREGLVKSIGRQLDHIKQSLSNAGIHTSSFGGSKLNGLTWTDITSINEITSRLCCGRCHKVALYFEGQVKTMSSLQEGTEFFNPSCGRINGGSSKRPPFDTTYFNRTGFHIRDQFTYVNCTLYGSDDGSIVATNAADNHYCRELVNAAARWATFPPICMDGQGVRVDCCLQPSSCSVSNGHL